MEQSPNLAITIQLETRNYDEEEIDRLARQLRREILGGLDVETVDLGSGSAYLPDAAKGLDPTTFRGIDPYILSLVVVLLAPTVLTKFLEFLNAWAMRHEEDAVRVKIKTRDGAEIEIEAPRTMSQAELQEWIAGVKGSLQKKHKK
jgi:hypothetical protein